MKKLLFLLVPLLLTSCELKQPEGDIIDFSLSTDKSILKVGETAEVTISLKNEREDVNFTYKSSNENVLKPISFKDNVISLSAIDIGEATITVTETKFQTNKTIDFNVNTVDIELNKNFLSLKKSGTPFQLKANFDEVTWESSDENVATVSSSGLVTAIEVGETTITARHKIATSCFATCNVVVATEYIPTKTTIKQTYKKYSKYSVFDNLACTSSKGEINLLIIPVWFTDSSTYITSAQKKEYVHDDIEAAYLGSNDDVGYRSVKTYYEEESSGSLTINGTVTDWYDTQADSSSYEDDSDDTKYLLQNAFAWAKTSQGINPKDYDCDGDGYIDGVILIYAHPDFQAMQVPQNNFWAYCGHDQSQYPSVASPTAGVYFWASYDFMYANYDSYTIDRTGTHYGNGNAYRQRLDTETFIHEMGHMFGLPDYYDYVSSYSPAGVYTMQDENVSTHDPYSYIALNWADPYIPTESCTITIGDFPTTHDVILLTPEWNLYESAFDEYILLELYSLTGLNEHYKGDWFHGIQLPNGVGVRAWHVDARLLQYPWPPFDESYITSDVTVGEVYKLCDNSHAKITDFPDEQRGSFICENQNMLQLISHNPSTNHGLLTRYYHFSNDDLFLEGSTFTMDTYKRQFLNIDSGNYYTSSDTDIRLNNRKKLNWSFTVNDITTKSDGSSTATITLTKLS